MAPPNQLLNDAAFDPPSERIRPAPKTCSPSATRCATTCATRAMFSLAHLLDQTGRQAEQLALAAEHSGTAGERNLYAAKLAWLRSRTLQ